MSGDPIVIPTAVILEVFRHAAETYPEECCGLLVGDQDTFSVDEVKRCVNQQNEMHKLDPQTFKRTAETAYFFGPEDSRFLDRSLRKDAPRVTRVIYHSHADVGPYFSASDRSAAMMSGEPIYPVTYLVVDAAKNGVMGAQLFGWNPKHHDFVRFMTYGPLGTPVDIFNYK